jgi:hypothetical protein
VSPTTFWIVCLAAPALVLVALRVRRQGTEHRFAYLKQFAVRAALSVLILALYPSFVGRFGPLWPTEDFESGERFVYGLLFWLLYYWSVGSFDRETWRAR